MTEDVEQPSEIEISAVLTRADGTVIDLGIVDAHYKNPLRQFAWTQVGQRLADVRIKRANRGVR